MSQISNLIKQEDVISIEKLCSKCRSSLDIDTQGGLTEFISYKPDEITKSIMPFILLNIEKGQTTVPVRYVACVHSKQYTNLCYHFLSFYEENVACKQTYDKD